MTKEEIEALKELADGHSKFGGCDMDVAVFEIQELCQLALDGLRWREFKSDWKDIKFGKTGDFPAKD